MHVVVVCVCETERQMEEQGSRTGGEAENSTIHLAVVLVVKLYPTGAENTQKVCELCVCAHARRMTTERDVDVVIHMLSSGAVGFPT